MAKKKVITGEDALKLFKDLTERMCLSDYYNVNSVLLSEITKDNNVWRVLLVPDQKLWELVVDSNALMYRELNILNPNEKDLQQWVRYGNDLNNDMWMRIENPLELFQGNVIKINISNRDYSIPITRELLPVKLKKAEYDDIYYRIFIDPFLVLAIRKRFEILPEFGFDLIRLFRIV